jgi:hypothetical protein
MDRAGLTDGDRAANRASEDGSGGADVVARQTGGYNFYYHLNETYAARFAKEQQALRAAA